MPTQDQLAGPASLLFQPDMKVEATDKQNPHLICVATIANIKDGKLLIHFDGWSNRSLFYPQILYNSQTILSVTAHDYMYYVLADAMLQV